MPTTERTQTVDFTPVTPGSYTLFVDVIDKDGTVKTAKIASYQVLATLTVDSLVVDKEAPQNIGTTIKLTATGSGGKAPYKYQFYYQWDDPADEDDVPIWKPIRSITTSKSISYPLPAVVGTYKFGVRLFDANSTREEIDAATEPGTYQFKLTVTDDDNDDANSNTAEKTLTYTIVNKAAIKTFKIDNKTEDIEVKKGTSIKLTAAGQYGIGTYQYKFLYAKDEGGTDEKMIRSFSGTPTFTYRIPAATPAGDYIFYVDIKDSKNATPTLGKNDKSKMVKVTVTD